MNKKNSKKDVKKAVQKAVKKAVPKEIIEIRKPLRETPRQPCSYREIEDGKFCVDKATKKRKERKFQMCQPYEDFSKGMCYPKCKPGYRGVDNRCIKRVASNVYLDAIKKRELEMAIRDASKRKEKFSNITSEWLNYNTLDNKLADLFDDNLKQYRWFFVVCLVILAFVIILNLLQSPNVEVKAPQQPTVIVQIPSSGLQVPQQVLQPALQTTSSPVTPQQIVQIPEAQVSPVKSDIPIKITDLKKGGFNKNIFSDIETSIFSDWNMSD
jgi:hypothetical protein